MLNGKILYSPKGAALEYAAVGCNFYKGCSNGCSYCYLRRGGLASEMGSDRPLPKKCFESENVFDGYLRALRVFKKELTDNLQEVIDNGGIFLSFSTDPCLPETLLLTLAATIYAVEKGVPVQILTKRAEWIESKAFRSFLEIIGNRKNLVKIGTTLTGHDELEPGASTNGERADMLFAVQEMGFPIFVSLEPVIDLRISFFIVCEMASWCKEFRIGLLSGGAVNFEKEDLQNFVARVSAVCDDNACGVMWKQSVRKMLPEFRFKYQEPVSDVSLIYDTDICANSSRPGTVEDIGYEEW